MNTGLLTVPAEQFTSVQRRQWDAAVGQSGHLFQARSFLSALETAWPGVFQPRHVVVNFHGEVRALIPAYLYASCPRLDYYRRLGPAPSRLGQEILVSHALVGWYGQPIFLDLDALVLAVRRFKEVAASHHTTALFTGIDERDAVLVDTLRAEGFHVTRFHTTVVKTLRDVQADDPTASLPKRRRDRVRNMVKRARDEGVCLHIQAGRGDPQAARFAARAWRDAGLEASALPEAFLQALLATCDQAETIVVTDTHRERLGQLICFHFGQTYVIWLASHVRHRLERSHHSHLLYVEALRRAASLGCTAVDAGRSPNMNARQLGYVPVGLLAAAWSADPAEQHNGARWLDALAARHLEQYPLLNMWTTAAPGQAGGRRL